MCPAFSARANVGATRDTLAEIKKLVETQRATSPAKSATSAAKVNGRDVALFRTRAAAAVVHAPPGLATRYIYTYIQTDRQTYRHTYIHTYIYTYIHTYTHIHTYILTYIHIGDQYWSSLWFFPINNIIIILYIHTYIHTYIHIHFNAYIYWYTHAYLHVHTRAYKCGYISYLHML